MTLQERRVLEKKLMKLQHHHHTPPPASNDSLLTLSDASGSFPPPAKRRRISQDKRISISIEGKENLNNDEIWQQRPRRLSTLSTQLY